MKFEFVRFYFASLKKRTISPDVPATSANPFAAATTMNEKELTSAVNYYGCANFPRELHLNLTSGKLMIYSLYYRPQRSWGKVIFSEACVNSSVHRGVCEVARGACVVAPRGTCMVALGGCVVAWGAYMVAPGGACMVAPGGCAWLLLGGMHGCCRGGHVWLLPGRGHAWDVTRYGDTINERAVRILLECILVLFS